MLSQIDEFRLEAVEPPIHTGGVLVQPIEASVDLIEALVDLIEASVDLIEALVDLIEASVDLIEALVETVHPPGEDPEAAVYPIDAAVDVLLQGLERRLKLRIHGVILLQSK